MSYELRLRSVIERYSIGIWGAKAMLPGGDWSIANLALWMAAAAAKYKVDIALMLAQAIAECHFGVNPAAGKSRRTKNIFNVGNTDDGSTSVQKSWQAGIDRYARLIATEYNYFDHPNDLVTLESFVIHGGKRPSGGVYSTTPGYPKLIKALGMRVRKSLA